MPVVLSSFKFWPLSSRFVLTRMLPPVLARMRQALPQPEAPATAPQRPALTALAADIEALNALRNCIAGV